MRNIALVSLMGIFIFLLNKFFLKSKNSYINFVVILGAIASTLSIKLNYSEFLFGEFQYIRLQIVLIILFFTWISVVNLSISNIKLDKYILLYIIFSMIFLLFYEKIDNISKFVNTLNLYLSILLIGLIFRNLKNYNYIKILSLFSYLSIFNGILSIFQYVTNRKLLPGVFNQSINYGVGGLGIVKRAVGIALTNNAAGNLAVILFAVTMFNYKNKKNNIHLFAIILNIIFAVLTLTRTAYLGIIVETIIFYCMTIDNKRKTIANKIIIIFLVIVGGIFVVQVYGDNIYNTLFLKRGNTAGSRVTQLMYIIKYMSSKIKIFTGVGPGQYRYYTYYVLNHSDIEVHSQYLNILVEQGWIIFVLFCIFNMYIFFKALKNTENKIEKSFVIALFLGNLICCNCNPNQDYYVNNYLYYILIYCIVFKRKLDIICQNNKFKGRTIKNA